MKRHPVLPEPDLTPYQNAVSEEKTSLFAPFSKQYLWRTILLLVVMVLGYAASCTATLAMVTCSWLKAAATAPVSSSP
jgi:hypothetical protein